MRKDTIEIVDELIRQAQDKLERNIQTAGEWNPVKLSNRFNEYWPFIKENVERIKTLSELKNFFISD